MLGFAQNNVGVFLHRSDEVDHQFRGRSSKGYNGQPDDNVGDIEPLCQGRSVIHKQVCTIYQG